MELNNKNIVISTYYSLPSSCKLYYRKFLNFLKNEGALERYIVNINNKYYSNSSFFTNKIIRMSEFGTYYYYIDHTLTWSTTNEGTEYWRILHNRWGCVYYKLRDAYINS